MLVKRFAPRMARLGRRLNATRVSGREMSSKTYFGAIDQGTSSTRFIIFDERLEPVASHQQHLDQSYPNPGWADMDPNAIFSSVNKCAEEAMAAAGIQAADLAAVGVTNQRETTVVWDRETGEPLAPAIVWFDDRSKDLCSRIVETVGGGDVNVFQKPSGLPVSSYFSAFKLKWLMENSSAVRSGIDAGTALFGTVESWLTFKLTGRHVTDCTNASRTILMDLETLQWSPDTCSALSIPQGILPEILPCAHPTGYGTVASGPLAGVRITGAIGDQQSALVGQRCFAEGQLKNTFGTGQFLLLNTGSERTFSDKGLLTTLAYQMGERAAPSYAVEGAVAISGIGIKWLQTNMGFGETPQDIIALAESVDACDGLTFVPAFTGLMAPHWADDARGIMIGWTNYHTRAHLSRALLEALCFQCKDVVSAMGVPPELIKVDGGVTQSEFVMQMLADSMEIPVERPANVETTALGAAISAGIGCGHWEGVNDVAEPVRQGKTFEVGETAQMRSSYELWQDAVQRSKGWYRR